MRYFMDRPEGLWLTNGEWSWGMEEWETNPGFVPSLSKRAPDQEKTQIGI